ALALAGMASGGALAWQFRQMLYACRDGWEWAVSLAACALALFTALRLARRIAARLAGTTASAAPPRWLRAGWLFALAYYGLLLAVDGRYRDFPLGLFWLPCLGYALLGWLGERHAPALPLPEERFLAPWLPLLAAVVLLQEAGLTAVAWLWLGMNLLLALPVLVEWHRARRLQPQQTQAADQ
ncbi:beta (1-6) glucan synthase, partial [Rhodanobacter denitrificans]